MKRKIALFVAIVSVVLSLMLAGCKQNHVVIDNEERKVIVTVSSDVLTVTENTTLEDYIKVLKEKDELAYEGSDSAYGLFITSINGIEPGLSEFWGIYTDDADNSDATWGIVEYKGKEYASATVGVSSLIIKEGKTYIFAVVGY